MDLEYSQEHEAFRESVRTFLKGWPLQGPEAELPIDEQESLFRKRGIEAGFVYRKVPKQYGGSEQPDDAIKDQIIQQEFYAAGAPRDLSTQGAGMLVPTLLEFGTGSKALDALASYAEVTASEPCLEGRQCRSGSAPHAQ